MDITRYGILLILLVSSVASALMVFFDFTGIGGIFHHQISELDNKYYQQVSPDPIVFSIIWPIAYIWNLAGILYIVASVFLPFKSSPIKFKPTLISKTFLGLYVIGFLSTVGRLFAFDNEKLGVTYGIMLLGAVALSIADGILYKVVHDSLSRIEAASEEMLWLIRILLQNGLALIATWMVIESFIGFCDLILYKDSPESETAILRGFFTVSDGSTLTLALMSSIIIVWFIMENFVWEKYCRYAFSTYPVFILFLSFLVVRLQYLEGGERNFVLACVDLGLAGAALLARIALSIYGSISGKYRTAKNQDCLKLHSHMHERDTNCD